MGSRTSLNVGVKSVELISGLYFLDTMPDELFMIPEICGKDIP